jgi:hypothetical protein
MSKHDRLMRGARPVNLDFSGRPANIQDQETPSIKKNSRPGGGGAKLVETPPLYHEKARPAGAKTGEGLRRRVGGRLQEALVIVEKAPAWPG